MSVQNAQLHLFVFLSPAAGVVFGGPIGDRFGRKLVIWVSILGVLPFTLPLPYVGLFWTIVLSFLIGLVLSSAFSSIIVYAQELVPGKVGDLRPLLRLAFGMRGLGAAAIRGSPTAWHRLLYHFCSFLPAIGLLTAFLPDLGRRGRPARARA